MASGVGSSSLLSCNNSVFNATPSSNNGWKTALKVSVLMLVLGLIVCIIVNNVKDNKVKDRCKNGLNKDCGKAVAGAAFGSFKQAAPLLACKNPTNPLCYQAIGHVSYTQLPKLFE